MEIINMKNMKRIIGILIGAFLLSPLSVWAQNDYEDVGFAFMMEWEDLQGYSALVSPDISGYFDEYDRRIKHGPCKVTFKEDLSSQVGQKLIITYNVSGNYVNNKLDGILTLEKSIITRSVSIKTSGKLNFNLGNPIGTWVFTETVTENGKSVSDKLTLSFQDNQMVSLNTNDISLKINNGNVTFSGKIDGVVYKNNVNTSEFNRTRSGTWQTCLVNDDAAVKSLINAYISGTMSESDLLSKGYAFNKTHEWSFSYTGGLSRFMGTLKVNKFWGERSSNFYSLEEPVLLTLMTVHVKTTEELIAIAESIKNANDVLPFRKKANISKSYTGFSTDWAIMDDNYVKGDHYGDVTNKIGNDPYYYDEGEYLFWTVEEIDNKYGVYEIQYAYNYNRNSIRIWNTDYYFTDEAKLQFQKAIMQSLEDRRQEQMRIAKEKRLEEERIAKERRIEQERLAEERRLREIEMQKKRLQPICDFLVSQKTSQKIAYDLSAINYFEPDVAGIGWQSDLKKAIKPFCKIVDCKIISLDKGLYVTKAVLEITKYVSKKKGTITYHVPVTINNDKILISSICISNATVVK